MSNLPKSLVQLMTLSLRFGDFFFVVIEVARGCFADSFVPVDVVLFYIDSRGPFRSSFPFFSCYLPMLVYS